QALHHDLHGRIVTKLWEQLGTRALFSTRCTYIGTIGVGSAARAGLHLVIARGLGDELAVLARAEADLGLHLDDQLREDLGQLVVEAEVLEPRAHLARGGAHDVVLRARGDAHAGRDRASHEIRQAVVALAALLGRARRGGLLFSDGLWRRR